MKKFSEGVGWCGTTLVVFAYFLNAFGFLTVESSIYHSMNLIGALFLGYSVVRKKAWAASALQVVWGGVAIVALVKMFF